MNERSTYDSNDEQYLAIRVLDEFLCSKLGVVSTYVHSLPNDTRNSWTATGPLLTDISLPNDDNTIPNLVTLPEVMTNKVQTRRSEPPMAIPFRNYGFATEPRRVCSYNEFDSPMIHDCHQYSTATRPPSVRCQAFQEINHCCSRSSPPKNQTKEPQPYRNINFPPPQLQSYQSVEQMDWSIMQPDIIYKTSLQQTSVEISNTGYQSPHDTSIAELYSASRVQTNTVRTIGSSNQESQSMVNLYEFVPERSLTIETQVNSFQSVDPTDRQTKSTAEKHRCTISDGRNTFVGERNLKEYHSPHTFEEPFHQCHLCDRRFLSPYHLKTHVGVHFHTDGEKQFQCGLCRKKFRNKKYLWNKHQCARHITDGKLFTGIVCRREFIRVPNLYRHYVRQHHGQEPF